MKLAKLTIKLTILGLSVVITGCANTKLANDADLLLQAQEQATQVTKTPEEMIQIAGERINNADADLRFYAPIHMERAQDKLAEARKMSQKEATPENQAAALSAAILAEQLIGEAEKNRAVVKVQLAQSLAHRDILIELGSPEIQPKAFNKGMGHLDDLIREIEGGNIDKVTREQPDLLEEFAKIEADTLRVKWLSEAESTFAEAEDNGAGKYAPASYEQAELAIERADDYIEINYRDREGVRNKSREAYILAAKALNVSKEVQKIHQKSLEEVEAYTDSIQDLFEDINQEAEVSELVSLTFYEQAKQIKESIRKQQDMSSIPEATESLENEPEATEPQTSEAPEIIEPAAESSENQD